MITPESRYNTATVITVPVNEAPRQTVVPPAPEDRVFDYTSYVVRDGDRVDVLSFRFLGQARLWWLLADANPERSDWMHLPRGAVLRIPRA